MPYDVFLVPAFRFAGGVRAVTKYVRELYLHDNDGRADQQKG